MKTIFSFNTAEIADFLQRIREANSIINAEKANFYNFDFDKGLPFSERQKSETGRRFDWEPVKRRPTECSGEAANESSPSDKQRARRKLKTLRKNSRLDGVRRKNKAVTHNFNNARC
eukprot:TRINITY_DN13194_c0_g1_i1.p1 TRINITY_DN13194_c0_g1~~TRINITY_DN13194_c0_g1_i1.p1  ORF type:complete len:117 (+),score=13.67 TRINITY_DN13194_c0_g1_i1:183-533(+)